MQVFKRQGSYKEIGDIGSDTFLKEIGCVKIGYRPELICVKDSSTFVTKL